MQNANVVDRLETISAKFDGDLQGTLPETLSAKERIHLENWSAIGAAMRGEMAEKTDFDFASKVMERIACEATPVVDQTSVKLSNIKQAGIKKEYKALRFVSLKKLGLLVAETAVAASLCMITVFGYQTWNAEDNMTIGEAVPTMGTLSGVNLASYQNRSNDHAISLDVNGAQEQHRLSPQEQRELAQKREQEAERISNYLKGYVLNTASN